MNTPSSSLTVAVKPLANMLEPVQRQGKAAVSEPALRAGAFEMVIEHAFDGDNERELRGESAKSKSKGRLTECVGNEDEAQADSKDAIDSKSSRDTEEDKTSISSGLPEGLACNLLLQVTAEPIGKAATLISAESNTGSLLDDASSDLPQNSVAVETLEKTSEGATQSQQATGDVPEKEVSPAIPVESKEAVVTTSLTTLAGEPKEPGEKQSVSSSVSGNTTKVENSVSGIEAKQQAGFEKEADLARKGNSGDMLEQVSQDLNVEGIRLKRLEPEVQATRQDAKEQTAEPDGTSTAKTTQTMQNAAKTGHSMQSLPGTVAKTAGLTRSVDAVHGQTPVSARGEANAISPEMALFAGGPGQVAMEQATKGMLNRMATVSLEQVEGQIRTQVVEFKRVGADSMSVVLKPDTQVELHLQLRMEHGQVHVVVECKRGDLAALNESWGQLQQNLAGQGIRVSALQDGSGTSFSGNWTGNFQRQEWQQQQNWEGTSYRYFGDDPKAAGNGSLSAPTAKSTGAPTKVGEKRALEMWA